VVRCRSPYVHIGILFSCVAAAAQLSFLWAFLIRRSPEYRRDSATRRSRKAGQRVITVS
jgi:hypothetical protein